MEIGGRREAGTVKFLKHKETGKFVWLCTIPKTPMQSQQVCSGCRTILLYPRGAANVCCVLCNVFTSVPPPGMEMSQLICGGCRTLLMYIRGASSVRCSCCHIMNLVPDCSRQLWKLSHNTCVSVWSSISQIKCVVCHFITNVNLCGISSLQL